VVRRISSRLCIGDGAHFVQAGRASVTRRNLERVVLHH
jgi:hypothetical protein